MQQLADDGTGEIAIATLGSGLYGNGHEHFMDEYAFAPVRARIKAAVGFKWTNFGVERHTIISSDGSWTTGPILPGQTVSMSISKPGTFEYFCTEHPWSKGQLVVSTASEGAFSHTPGVDRAAFTPEQAARGKVSFQSNCSNGCHMPDLTPGQRAPALAGDSFLQHWKELTVDELFQRIRSTMPQQKPQSLSDQVYIDIVAFLLQANGLPSGNIELKSDPAVLKSVIIRAVNGERQP